MNEVFIAKLQELPGKIEETERSLIDTRNLISADERSLKFIEIQLKRDISEETIEVPGKEGEEPKKKAKYTNEKARDDELYVRTKNDERYIAMEKSLEDKRSRLQILQVEHTRLENEFKAYRAIAYMIGGK